MSIPIDTWGDEPSRTATSFASTSGSSSKPRMPPQKAVLDDWELDDDEDEQEVGQVVSEEHNKRIWEDANTKEHHPMPTVVISRGAAAPITTPNLPLNQPPAMRILKRPSASPSQSSTNVTSPAGETFQEREARYQAARERIFGSPSEDSKETTDKTKNLSSKKVTSPSTSPPPPATKVVREPRGPPNSNNNASGKSEDRGFGERKAKRPPPSTTVATGTMLNSSSDIPI